MDLWIYIQVKAARRKWRHLDLYDLMMVSTVQGFFDEVALVAWLVLTVVYVCGDFSSQYVNERGDDSARRPKLTERSSR